MLYNDIIMYSILTLPPPLTHRSSIQRLVSCLQTVQAHSEATEVIEHNLKNFTPQTWTYIYMIKDVIGNWIISATHVTTHVTISIWMEFA